MCYSGFSVGSYSSKEVSCCEVRVMLFLILVNVASAFALHNKTMKMLVRNEYQVGANQGARCCPNLQLNDLDSVAKVS